MNSRAPDPGGHRQQWRARPALASAALPCFSAKVDFLSQPASYGAGVQRVECIETHLSWVFLAGNLAYKIKKPVRTEHVDLRALEARHHYCNEELRLNRRLAGAVYIAVVPLVVDATGRMHLGENATIVDWLVKMQRLPSWLMLDAALAHRRASADDACRIAATLARFHGMLPLQSMAPAAYRGRLGHQLNVDRAELGQPDYGLPTVPVGALFDTLFQALRRLADVLDRRVLAGHLVEGHGDLRPEHVCLLPEIAIIDCLEFSRDLRVLDRADEVGFLALECERLGAARFGAVLTRAYRQNCGDDPPAALVHFYQGCRASTRAMLAIRHLKEEKFRHSPHWRSLAMRYLALAARHAHASCIA